MGKAGSVVRKTLVWHYERGTLQYDIICALILAFIFFVPRSCFVKTEGPQAQTQKQNSTAGIIPK